MFPASIDCANGFSLHAGVSCEGSQRNKRERLCRYIARSAVAIPRLSLSSTGKVVYTLKTPYRDGTTQVAFDPVDFMARLAALVPKPRVNLTRYHGVMAPNRRWRGWVTPARRGKELKKATNTEPRTPVERHQVRCLFSWERARGSRTGVITVQPAGTPLNNRSAWAPVGYSRKTISKDLQVDQCKRDFSTLSGHRAINSCKASGYWKEISPYSPFIRLILQLYPAEFF